MYINNIDNIAKKKKKRKIYFINLSFSFQGGKCYVHTQLFLALYMCIFILVSPVAIFRTGFSLVEYCSGSFQPFYNLITRNYATNFNMNFLEVSWL